MDFNRCGSRQKGFLLPIVLFLIVIASGVAFVVSKQLEQSALLSVDLILYDKSLYAAEMGAQLGLNKLLFMHTSNHIASEHSNVDSANNIDTASYDMQCKALSINQVFSLTELKNCNFSVSCRSQSAGADSDHYTIESIAACGTLDITLNSATDRTLDNPVDEIIFSTSLKARNITRNTPKDTAKEITQVSTKVDTKNNAAVGPVNNSPIDIVLRGSFTEVATKTVIISRVFKTQ
ncbi:MAG: MSHA biogenesis protein MshP [Cellvibrionaceae bacterium]|jgi:MSHA biogenesis protein MshP